MKQTKTLVVCLFILCALTLPCAAQTADIPTDRAGVVLTLTPDPKLRPGITYEHLIVPSAELYSYSEYTVVGMTKHPLSLQIAAMTGVSGPVKKLFRLRWWIFDGDVRVWGIGDLGLAQSTDHAGYVYALGGYPDFPLKHGLSLYFPMRVIKSSLADFEGQYSGGLKYSWGGAK